MGRRDVQRTRKALTRLRRHERNKNGIVIPHYKVTAGRKVTYMTIVCTHKPSKSDPERVRLCVGGDMLEYHGNIRTLKADLTTVKILINSTISTKSAKFTTMDIKNFYLGTPMYV